MVLSQYGFPWETGSDIDEYRFIQNPLEKAKEAALKVNAPVDTPVAPAVGPPTAEFSPEWELQLARFKGERENDPGEETYSAGGLAKREAVLQQAEGAPPTGRKLPKMAGEIGGLGSQQIDFEGLAGRSDYMGSGSARNAVQKLEPDRRLDKNIEILKKAIVRDPQNEDDMAFNDSIVQSLTGLRQHQAEIMKQKQAAITMQLVNAELAKIERQTKDEGRIALQEYFGTPRATSEEARWMRRQAKKRQEESNQKVGLIRQKRQELEGQLGFLARGVDDLTWAANLQADMALGQATRGEAGERAKRQKAAAVEQRAAATEQRAQRAEAKATKTETEDKKRDAAEAKEALAADEMAVVRNRLTEGRNLLSDVKNKNIVLDDKTMAALQKSIPEDSVLLQKMLEAKNSWVVPKYNKWVTMAEERFGPRAEWTPEMIADFDINFYAAVENRQISR